MSIPLVSVITPCYNQARYLPDALESLLSQTCKNWECIIVNDGSTDNTEDVALSYCKEDRRIQYYFKQNSGVCDSRNFAVSKSKGKYLLPLDADDKISESYIENIIKTFESDETIDVVYGNAVFYGEHNGEIKLKSFNYKTLLLENVFYNSVAFRRERFEYVGGYNLNMKKGWEDWELMISLLNENSKVVKIPELCYYYRILSGSRERSISDKQRESLFLQIYENHKSIYDKFFPNPIRFAYLHRLSENRSTALEQSIDSLQKSKKYKLVQKLAKIINLLPIQRDPRENQ